MRKVILIFVVYYFSIIPSLFSQNQNFENLIFTKDGYNYVLEFKLTDYFFDTITIDYGNGITEDFINIILNDNDDEYGYIDSLGLPELPHYTFMMAVPYDSSAPKIVVNNITTELNYNDYKISPSQEYQSTDPNESKAPFYIDETYYSTSGINYSPVSITDEFILAGVKGIRITVYPFSYNPLQNIIEIRKNINFEVQLEGEITTNYPSSNVLESFFANIFVNDIINPTEKSQIKGNYLIITAPEFESTLTYFANFKRNTGYNVTVVSTNTTGSTKENIKDYIQAMYDNTSTRPVFVLLVGDTDKIPCWIGEHSKEPRTDLYYATLDGNDRVADVFIGRFSAPLNNIEYLQNIINKTIYMESNLHNLSKKAVFLADDDTHIYTEAAHNSCIEKAFDPSGYTSLKLYANNGATHSDAVNAINDNHIFAIYSGHGNVTGFVNPSVQKSDITSSSNTVFPLGVSFACETNKFEETECFGEAWIRYKHGGVAFYGASHTTFYHVDRPFEKKLFINGWYKDNNEQLGPIIKTGMERLCDNLWSSNYRHKYREMYNLMGDPSLSTIGMGCVNDFVFFNNEIFHHRD